MPFVIRCPACKSSSVRLTIPEGPEVQTFRCNDCDRRWSQRLTATRRLLKRTCPACDSANLMFIEHTPTTAIYRCNGCERIIALPIPPR